MKNLAFIKSEKISHKWGCRRPNRRDIAPLSSGMFPYTKFSLYTCFASVVQTLSIGFISGAHDGQSIELMKKSCKIVLVWQLVWIPAYKSVGFTFFTKEVKYISL